MRVRSVRPDSERKLFRLIHTLGGCEPSRMVLTQGAVEAEVSRRPEKDTTTLAQLLEAVPVTPLPWAGPDYIIRLVWQVCHSSQLVPLAVAVWLRRGFNEWAGFPTSSFYGIPVIEDPAAGEGRFVVCLTPSPYATLGETKVILHGSAHRHDPRRVGGSGDQRDVHVGERDGGAGEVSV